MAQEISVHLDRTDIPAFNTFFMSSEMNAMHMSDSVKPMNCGGTIFGYKGQQQTLNNP